MNSRYFIIAAVILLILTIFIVAFIGIVFKESSRIGTKAAPSVVEETGIAEEITGASYSIPSNIIPTSQELADRARDDEERRAEYEELCAQIEKGRSKRKAEQKAAQQKLQDKSAENNPLPILQDKNVVSPTIEERKEMESKGIISF